MKLWPGRKISFATSLNCELAIERLHADIAPPKLYAQFPTSQPGRRDELQESRMDFYGRRLTDGGAFMRNFHQSSGEPTFSQAFRAETRCHIAGAAHGATVTAHMRMGQVAMISLLTLIAISITVLAMAWPQLNAQTTPWMPFIPLVLTTVLWLFACFAFSEDAQTTERLLRAGLERP